MKKRLTTILSALALCGTVAVASESIPADTNGDGVVNKEDAMLIYSYILGTADATVTATQVDVNGDGIVNTADVVEVYKTVVLILGDVSVSDWENGGNFNGGEAEE